MDKLINYIEYRQRMYGQIERSISSNSMYYNFGYIKVRVSDHMKYSEDELKKYDYYFMIQPNDTYIFMTSPKYVKNGYLNMKVVSYTDAKEFIKSIHEYSLKLNKMMDWYSPDDWNNLTNLPKTDISSDTDKMSWDNFYSLYFDGQTEEYGQRIANKIESLVYGKLGKGTINKKMDRIKTAYCMMSKPQYESVMKKIAEI
jgi:hypothetical protein